VGIHKDPKVLSDLFVMYNKTKVQDELFSEMTDKINDLNKAIDNYIGGFRD